MLTIALSDISTFPIPADFTSELQRLESSQFTFPDDRAIDVPELQGAQYSNSGGFEAAILGTFITFGGVSKLIPPEISPECEAVFNFDGSSYRQGA